MALKREQAGLRAGPAVAAATGPAFWAASASSGSLGGLRFGDPPGGPPRSAIVPTSALCRPRRSGRCYTRVPWSGCRHNPTPRRWRRDAASQVSSEAQAAAPWRCMGSRAGSPRIAASVRRSVPRCARVMPTGSGVALCLSRRDTNQIGTITRSAQSTLCRRRHNTESGAGRPVPELRTEDRAAHAPHRHPRATNRDDHAARATRHRSWRPRFFT